MKRRILIPTDYSRNARNAIDYAIYRYIKYNYQLKDTTTVGKYPILSIPYSTESSIKKLHIYLIKNPNPGDVYMQFIFSDSVKQYEKYYMVNNDLNIHQFYLTIPSDLTTAINIKLDGVAGVLQDNINNYYEQQVWLQLNEAPTNNQTIVNDGALNITGNLTNPNRVDDAISGPVEVFKSAYPSYDCFYIDTPGKYDLKIDNPTDITSFDILLIGAGGYGGKNGGGRGGGGGIVAMSRNLTKGSTIKIQVGVCNDILNEGDTYIDIDGTITKAGRGGDGGYLDGSDQLEIDQRTPYNLVYDGNVVQTVYLLNTNSDITLKNPNIPIHISEDGDDLYAQSMLATSYKYGNLDYLLYTEEYTNYDGDISDDNSFVILWLKFDDSTYLIDSSPNNFQFSISNGGVFFDSTAKVKGSYSLDYRSTIYPNMDIYMTSQNIFPGNTDTWTVCFWVYLYTVNTNQIILEHYH